MGRTKKESSVVKLEIVKKPIKHADKVWAMYQRGASLAEIAKKLGMSRQNAHRILVSAGHPPRNQRGCCSQGKCAFAMTHGCRCS